jgi:hypothetical protein
MSLGWDPIKLSQDDWKVVSHAILRDPSCPLHLRRVATDFLHAKGITTMPALFDKTPGEIIDRLCILDLKIRAAVCRGGQRRAWEEERIVLFQALVPFFGDYTPTMMSLDLRVRVLDVWGKLADTVSEGWRLEDRTRAGEPVMHAEAQALNDDRIGYVQQLNDLFAVPRANVDKI